MNLYQTTITRTESPGHIDDALAQLNMVWIDLSLRWQDADESRRDELTRHMNAIADAFDTLRACALTAA